MPPPPGSVAEAYFKRNTPCGGLRITKLRHACLAQLAARKSGNSSAGRVRDDAGTSEGPRCLQRERAAPAAPPATCSLAVCFFGMLARYDDSRGAHFTNLWLTEHVAFASVRERILVPNTACATDVFVHSWHPQHAEFVRRVLRPRLDEFGMRADQRTGMFLSIERVLELRRRAEQERGAAYVWVLLTRPDVVWMADLRFASLSPSLLYVANWCKADAARTRVEGDRSCRSLRVFAPTTHQLDGVPDYFFAGSPTLLDRVFIGLAAGLERGSFAPARRSCCNHAIVAGRLKALRLWGSLGRVLWHHMDVENIRVPKYDLQRYMCHLELSRWGAPSGGVERVPTAARERAPRGAAPLRECDALGESGHWVGEGEEARLELQAEPALLQSAAPVSRCPASLYFCICDARRTNWSRYPQLSGEVR